MKPLISNKTLRMECLRLAVAASGAASGGREANPRLNRVDSIIEMSSVFFRWVTTDVDLSDDDDYGEPRP